MLGFFPVARPLARVQIQDGVSFRDPRETGLDRSEPRGRRWLTGFRRGGRAAPPVVLAHAVPLGVRFREARSGSVLAFMRDSATIVAGLFRKLLRSPLLQRTLSLQRRLEITWHASGAATHLADAALAGESTQELATRIARIARTLSKAQAAAVFGRGPTGPVLFGHDGGVPAADLAARTLQTRGAERRSEGQSRAVSVPLRMRDALVGALVLRFAPETPIALHALEPLLQRAAAVLAAAEREARKDRFLSLAAHELKTPLTSIKGFAYSLSRRLEKGEPADPGSVQILERQAERLHGLLEEMLEVSRLEMGRFVLHQEPCELGELAHAALRSHRRLGSETGVRIDSPEPVPLTADRERIERAVAAMIARARTNGSPVTVTVGRLGSKAVVTVAWKGAPLAPEERARVLEARWEDPQPQRQGLGMALYIAARAVALHGGELISEPNAVVLTLPIRPSIAQKGSATGGRVLVVDDDEALARMMAEFLGEHGFTADWAGGGRPALQKLRRQASDLLVLDLRMPDLDGRGLLQQVRRDGMDPRVVLLSADREVAAAARELRAEGFVEKPFAPESLLAAVRRALAPK